ncbi:MAG: DUF2442 domain-containing protein [Longimicrobiales bacterium]|nr:DUF2442 domain-containing protein [Longimicrobiales bacterium]
MVKRLDEAALAAQIARARGIGRAADRSEPRAKGARYDRRTGLIELALSNGCFFSFPAAQAEGLDMASADELARVEILGNGYALRWEALDVDLTVPGLLAGRLGSMRWMAEEMGRAGGRVRSVAKARAARQNGRKGGRPGKKRAGT